MQEVATFLPLQCKFANLGAHRDHWVHRCWRYPSRCSFPHRIGRDFDLQWKTASGLSYLLLQLVVTAGKRAFHRRALRRPHPARREVTWRHWYGLAQAWGSTTYDWSLGQILPRSREEGCQQNLTEALSQGRHGFTMRETLPWKNTHMGLPEGESGHTDT